MHQVTILKTLAEVEKEHILFALKQNDFNRVRTAKAIGCGVRTVQRKLRSYGLENIGLETRRIKETNGALHVD